MRMQPVLSNAISRFKVSFEHDRAEMLRSDARFLFPLCPSPFTIENECDLKSFSMRAFRKWET